MFSSQEIYANVAIPGWLKEIYSLNPMVCVIDGFRWCMFGAEVPIDVSKFLVSLAVSFLMLIIGVITFRKMEKDFVDVI